MIKALFLDRDGIINIDHGYVYKIAEFEFVEGIFELCQKALQFNYQIIVITNQAGIARGYYSENDFLALTHWMKTEFKKHDVAITDVLFCPHHPTSGVNKFKQQCDCRKPAPGMILKAQRLHNIDLQQSIFVGDKDSDMQAAKSAEVKHRILVSSEYNQISDFATLTLGSVKEIAEKSPFSSII